MLIGVSEILSKSWVNYQKNWRAFVPYIIGMILPNLFIYATGYLGIVLENRLGWAMFTGIFTLIVMIVAGLFSFWFGIAFAKAIRASLINEPIDNWKTGLKTTSHFIIPAILTSLLVGIIVFAGTILLVVPGIIFAGWYSFTFYNVIFDNKKNTAALKASKEMVVGRWWAVIWRLAIPAIIFSIASAVIAGVITWPFGKIGILDVYNLQIIANTISAIVGSVLTPLLIGAQVALYLSAKENPVAKLPIVEQK